MKITKTQAVRFIRDVKRKHPHIRGMRCEIQERFPLEDKKPNECNILNDTDLDDSSRCDPFMAQWILNAICKGEHPNVLSLAFYRFDGIWNGSANYELYDHVWVEYCKEKFKKWINGEDFETTTTSV